MEYIIIGLLSVILLFLIIKYVGYRRQVQDICRQLQFIENNTTNQKVRINIVNKEIVQLTDLINEMYESHNNKEIELLNKDKRLKETLTAVSHDIRTPLTSLKGYFELLMEEDSVDNKKEYAAIMSERMNDLSELLDELFTYTKLQNKEYKLELQQHDMTKLVLDCIFSFYEIFKKKGVEMDFDIDQKSYMVMCNDIAIKRVITNIIKNAYVHGKSRVAISYGATKESQHKRIFFTCSNDVNRPEEIDMKQIFERFYKADRSRNEKSTGLGLAIAKEMVDRMNGCMEAALENDVFTITVLF